MRKIENGLPGYFTVEAAMVMPIVFAVYIFMISMLIYIYEGCIWEQNGFRMLVQKPYLDGYVRMHGDVTETKIGEKEICRYILEKNKEEISNIVKLANCTLGPMFILGFKLVPYIYFVSSWSFMF